MTPRRRDRAFTLIEVVATMVIASVLIALLLSAVISSRNSARNLQCKNNLRQISLALTTYAAAANVLPQGANGFGYSSLAMILPQLDKTPTYNSINFSINFPYGWVAPENTTAAKTQVATFICPANPIGNATEFYNSYAGNRGVGVQRYGYNGAFNFELDGPIGVVAFSDGTSTTALYSEWVLGAGITVGGCQSGMIYQTQAAYHNPNDFDLFIDACANACQPSHAVSPRPKQPTWIRGELRHTLYNHTLTPNGPSCTNGSLIQQGAWTAGSGHNGTVNCSFADGHVASISGAVSRRVWHAIGSRNGAEILLQEDLTF